MVMWVVSFTIMWAVRVVVGFKCYGVNGLYFFMYTKDERAGGTSISLYM